MRVVVRRHFRKPPRQCQSTINRLRKMKKCRRRFWRRHRRCCTTCAAWRRNWPGRCPLHRTPPPAARRRTAGSRSARTATALRRCPASPSTGPARCRGELRRAPAPPRPARVRHPGAALGATHMPNSDALWRSRSRRSNASPATAHRRPTRRTPSTISTGRSPWAMRARHQSSGRYSRSATVVVKARLPLPYASSIRDRKSVV